MNEGASGGRSTAITSPPVILGRGDQRLKTPEVGPRRQMNC